MLHELRPEFLGPLRGLRQAGAKYCARFKIGTASEPSLGLYRKSAHASIILHHSASFCRGFLRVLRLEIDPEQLTLRSGDGLYVHGGAPRREPAEQRAVLAPAGAAGGRAASGAVTSGSGLVGVTARPAAGGGTSTTGAGSGAATAAAPPSSGGRSSVARSAGSGSGSPARRGRETARHVAHKGLPIPQQQVGQSSSLDRRCGEGASLR